MISRISIFLSIFFLSCTHVQTERQPSSLKTTCEKLVSIFFTKKSYLSEEELDQLVYDIKRWEQIDLPSLQNESGEFFYHIILSAPESVKNIIFNWPEDPKVQNQIMRLIDDKTHSALVERIFSTIKRKSQGGSFDIKALEKSWEKLSEAELKKIKDRVAKLSLESRAQKNYQSNYYASINISNNRIQIGNAFYLFKKEKAAFIVSVPREKIKTPAWNPINQEQVNAIVANPAINPPKVYEATLGLDGNFYLLDGNHRFRLKESREVIQVKISELKTAPFRIFLDLIGAPQPSIEKTVSIYEKEAHLYDLLPDDFLQRVIWQENELYNPI